LGLEKRGFEVGGKRARARKWKKVWRWCWGVSSCGGGKEASFSYPWEMKCRFK